ncbi:MAG: hypothetical protein H0W36_06255 [Gemmatimonadetes bacterium]|nr:hypothetical protein [Gemmatimonadota bacterium]
MHNPQSCEVAALRFRAGKVYYDDAGSAAGLVVALDDGDDEDLVESGEEARAWLEDRGYALDDASVAAIGALTQAKRQEASDDG